MENEDFSLKAKRMKLSNEQLEMVTEDDGDVASIEKNRGEEAEENAVGSEQILAEIAGIHEQIQCFTQLVCELLESGKSMLKDLSNEFEERMILIHKERIQMWEAEIHSIRLVDASNVQENAVLQNAKSLLQNVCGES